jgi:hypothetical protein
MPQQIWCRSTKQILIKIGVIVWTHLAVDGQMKLMWFILSFKFWLWSSENLTCSYLFIFVCKQNILFLNPPKNDLFWCNKILRVVLYFKILFCWIWDQLPELLHLIWKAAHSFLGLFLLWWWGKNWAYSSSMHCVFYGGLAFSHSISSLLCL